MKWTVKASDVSIVSFRGLIALLSLIATYLDDDRRLRVAWPLREAGDSTKGGRRRALVSHHRFMICFVYFMEINCSIVPSIDELCAIFVWSSSCTSKLRRGLQASSLIGKINISMNCNRVTMGWNLTLVGGLRLLFGEFRGKRRTFGFWRGLLWTSRIRSRDFRRNATERDSTTKIRRQRQYHAYLISEERWTTKTLNFWFVISEKWSIAKWFIDAEILINSGRWDCAREQWVRAGHALKCQLFVSQACWWPVFS